MTVAVNESTTRIATFFRFAFADVPGFVCIAVREHGTTKFSEEFFHLPDELDKLVAYVVHYTVAHDVWFCPQLLLRKQRRKDAVHVCTSAWADLDTCDPSALLVEPSLTVESSPGRFQALWRFAEPVDPTVGEDISRRIAYYHADEGADKSGWDLTQLLRVPFTYNHKYGGVGVAPMVRVIATNPTLYAPTEFEPYPSVKEFEWSEIPLPKELPNADDVLLKYRLKLHPMVYTMHNRPPGDDWSKQLWTLENLLFEGGLEPAEVFAVVRECPFNKYERDSRSQTLLWREVLRCWQGQEERKHSFAPVASIEGAAPLITDEEKQWVRDNPTLVEEYVEWAKTLGDAAWPYHQAGIFTLLSSLLASFVRLPTSFGAMKLNIWFMILADTTLTRKTTAMDIAMDLLGEVDPDAVLATDGSIEGLFSALSHRPGRSSIFLRDEFSGLLESMVKKDYYAGMAETLTKMYDGKMQKRILKRETIEVRDPVLLMFCGGIKNKIFELLTYEHVLSGFLPRFIFITADADLTRLKPLGPPTVVSDKKRRSLIERLQAIHDFYSAPVSVVIDGKASYIKKDWNAELTEEAWRRYNVIEQQMVEAAMDSTYRDYLMPTFDRLSKSGLKIAVILAALRCQDKIVVTEQDIVRAFYYIEQWRGYTLEVLSNIGKTPFERTADAIVRTIQAEEGVFKGTLMRMFHLSSRQAEDMFNTLEQRGLIQRVKSARTERFYTPGHVVQEDNKNVSA